MCLSHFLSVREQKTWALFKYRKRKLKKGRIIGIEVIICYKSVTKIVKIIQNTGIFRKFALA